MSDNQKKKKISKELMEDYNSVTEKNIDKYLKKYKLPSHKDYLIGLYKTYQEIQKTEETRKN